jgi:hypothetical protein
VFRACRIAAIDTVGSQETGQPVIDLIKELPDIQGCYLLTPTGTLGTYQPDRRFHPDVEISQALAAPIGQLLQEFRGIQDSRWLRLGVVHANHDGKPWRSATLALADDVLRRLYPMSAARDGRMTSFQLRHREQSLFRGMELLLDYRDPAIPEIPYFCPVLVYRGTTLAHYLPWPERPTRDADRQTVAVEVVDLLAGLARSQRNVPSVTQLVVAERQALVHPERRRAPGLGLVDDVLEASAAARRSAAAPPPPPKPAPPVEPYAGDQDAPAIAEIETRFAANGFRDFDYAEWFEAHSPPQSQERFGAPPAAGGYRFRGAEELRFFARFEGLGRAALELIAAKSPVFKVPAGTLLLDRGTRDRWNLYLLSGELELAGADGALYPLAGGSASARQPVAFLKPRLFSVSARSEVEFLWLYEPMIEAVKRLHPSKLAEA